MKYIILVLTFASFGSIAIGYFIATKFSEKFIGFGVLGLFLIVIPLFSYYRWKGKNVKCIRVNSGKNQVRGRLHTHRR